LLLVKVISIVQKLS